MATKTLTEKTAQRIGDGLHNVRRFAVNKAHDLEDFRDATGLKIRRAPFASVALALTAGVLLGFAVGSLRRSRE